MGALPFNGGSETSSTRLDSLSLLRGRNRVGGATRFSGFSSFREMTRQECKIARAEREAAAKEKMCLWEKAFEFKLQLMRLQRKKQSSSVAGGEPRAAGSRGKSGRLIQGAV